MTRRAANWRRWKVIVRENLAALYLFDIDNLKSLSLFGVLRNVEPLKDALIGKRKHV